MRGENRWRRGAADSGRNAVAYNVELKVNGNDVRMNDFVRRVLAGVVEGFVRSLNEIPESAERIEIVVEKR